MQNREEGDVVISSTILHHDLYYFALPLGSPLRRIVDIQLSWLHKNNLGDSICGNYLMEKAKNCDL